MGQLQQSFKKTVHNKSSQLSVGESKLSRSVSMKYDGTSLKIEQQAKTRIIQPQSSKLTQLNIIHLGYPALANYAIDEQEDV